MKIAIFLPNWVGDVVMATPALAALREHFGDRAQLIGVMKPYVADVLAGTDYLNDQLIYQPRGGTAETGNWSLVKRLRRLRPDVVLLLTNSPRTALLAALGGARRRVGFSRSFRGLLLTDKLRMKADWLGRLLPQSALDNYLRLVTLLGCEGQFRAPQLGTLPQDEAAADDAWRRLALPPSERVVVFHTGGGWGGKSDVKAWPADHFAELARRIVTRHDLGVLVLCGPAERETAAHIAAAAGNSRVASLAGEMLGIGLSKACVRRSRLMVTTDSGPRHFAHAFGVPVVTLFGPTHQEWSETHYGRAIHLQREVPCGPCQKRACPLKHHRCMNELTVDEVFRAVEAQLRRTSRQAA